VLHWLFRIALCAEFVGHGAFGILQKPIWVPYFQALGFSEAWAYTLMPLVGSVDITFGLIMLFSPRRSVMLYMAVWGLFTALIRPLAGESFFEVVERSYNYGIPFLALVAHWREPRDWKFWFAPVHSADVNEEFAPQLSVGLRFVIGLMLIGHGGYGLIAKQGLLRLYENAGLQMAGLPLSVGWFEVLLGGICLSAQWTGWLWFVLAWKLASESIYFPANAFGAFWEFLERGGSYAAPLLLIIIQKRCLQQDARE
jgi:hypothetical protein